MQRGHSYRQRLFCYLQQRMIQGKPTPPQTTFLNIPGDFICLKGMLHVRRPKYLRDSTKKV